MNSPEEIIQVIPKIPTNKITLSISKQTNKKKNNFLDFIWKAEIQLTTYCPTAVNWLSENSSPLLSEHIKPPPPSTRSQPILSHPTVPGQFTTCTHFDFTFSHFTLTPIVYHLWCEAFIKRSFSYHKGCVEQAFKHILNQIKNVILITNWCSPFE